jgi:broad specificity phosphatase PhoE
MARAVIFLVRHGETEWNRVHRYQGWGDSPLTARGVAQAEAIGRRLCTLREAEAAEIVASPIGRARRTAEIIRGRITADGLGRAASLRFDERLRENSIGAWDGLDRDEIAARAPGIFDGDGRHEWYFRTPDGETYDDFAARIAAWLAEQDGRSVMPDCHARPR